jgi:TorA maturation chaperone TorD
MKLDDRSPSDIGDVDPIDQARAQEYALLAALMSRPPDAELLRRLGEIRGDPTPLGTAHHALAQAASRTTPERVACEYFDLFIGLGRGELVPYGSYYLTGFLQERPLVRLRHDLEKLGIERVPHRPETEDHVAILCEIMAGVVSGFLPAPRGADRALFAAHLSPWMEKFFAELQQAKTASFYREVGAFGRLFIAIDAEAFALPA